MRGRSKCELLKAGSFLELSTPIGPKATISDAKIEADTGCYTDAGLLGYKAETYRERTLAVRLLIQEGGMTAMQILPS